MQRKNAVVIEKNKKLFNSVEIFKRKENLPENRQKFNVR